MKLAPKNKISLDSIFDFNDKELKAKSTIAWGEHYFEPQNKIVGGMHSLNNTVGEPHFDRTFCDAACAIVCAITGEHPLHHKSKSVGYSASGLQKILALAFPSKWRMLMRNVVPNDWSRFTSFDDVVGILVNIEEGHWVSIVKVNGFVFYVDPIYWPRLLMYCEFQEFILSQPAAYFVITNDSALS